MAYQYSPDKLNEFLKNANDKNPGLHNIYHIQSVNENGEVTDEAFGLNLMTYWGFYEMYRQAMYWPNIVSYNSAVGSLWLGDGNTQPSPNDFKLTQPSAVITIAATPTDDYYTNAPEVYDADTGLITTTRKMIRVMYDYNIAGVTTDYTFSEMGMNYTYYNWTPTAPVSETDHPLWTHTLVYDINGNPTTFTKRVNERMYITIYFSFSIKAKLFEDLYNKGMYFAGSVASLLSTKNRTTGIDISYWSPMYEEKRRMGTRPFFTTESDMDSLDIRSQYTNDNTNWLSESQYNSGLSTITCYGSDSTAFLLIDEDCKMDTPETLVTEVAYTDLDSLYDDKLSLSLLFGGRYNVDGRYTSNEPGSRIYTSSGLFPVADFNMQSSYMYNYDTNEWDIQETIYNTPNCYLNHAFTCSVPIRYSHNGADKTMYVFINTRTDIPITKFDNTNWAVSSPMYATDTFWDPSSWEVITSPTTSIPQGLQNKRYYLAPSRSDRGILMDIRDQDYYAIVPSEMPSEIDIPKRTFASSALCYNFRASDTGNWIMLERQLVYPDISSTPIVWDMPSTSVPGYGEFSRVDEFIMSAGNRWSTDDRFIVVDVGASFYSSSWVGGYNYNRVRVYTISDDGSEPTYEDVRFDIGVDVKTTNIGRLHYSFNGTRYLVMYDPYRYHVGFLDIYGPDNVSPTVTMLEGKLAFGTMIYHSDLMIYHESVTTTAPTTIQNDSVWNIYNMSTNQIVDTFELPSAYVGGSITSVLGFSNHVYIRITIGSNVYTFHYDTTLKQLSIMEGFNDPYAGYYIPSDVHVMYWGDYSGHPIVFHDDFMHVTGNIDANYRDTTNNSYIYKASDPLHPVNDMFATSNWGLWGRAQMMPNIWETPDKKHLLVTACGTNYSWYAGAVFDYGYYLNTGKAVRYPFAQAKMHNTSNARNAIGYYKNGIIQHRADGSLFRYPLEQFLPHKITGTTYTIQSYNNPKRIYGAGYKSYIGLRDNMWEYSTTGQVEMDRFIGVQSTFDDFYRTHIERSITTTANALLVAVIMHRSQSITLDNGGWVLLSELDYSRGGETYIMSVYVRTAAAGTHTLTVDTDVANIDYRFMAIYGASSLTEVVCEKIPSFNYTLPAPSGKRRLYVFTTPPYVSGATGVRVETYNEMFTRPNVTYYRNMQGLLTTFVNLWYDWNENDDKTQILSGFRPGGYVANTAGCLVFDINNS